MTFRCSNTCFHASFGGLAETVSGLLLTATERHKRLANMKPLTLPPADTSADSAQTRSVFLHSLLSGGASESRPRPRVSAGPPPDRCVWGHRWGPRAPRARSRRENRPAGALQHQIYQNEPSREKNKLVCECDPSLKEETGTHLTNNNRKHFTR